MEVLTEIGKQSPVILLSFAIIRWLLNDRKALTKEKGLLQDRVILLLNEQTEREKEIGNDKREDQETTLRIIQGQTDATKSHTEAIKELSNQIRYDRKS